MWRRARPFRGVSLRRAATSAALPLPIGRRRSRCGCSLCLAGFVPFAAGPGYHDFGSFAQPVGTVNNDFLARLEPVENSDVLAISRADLDLLHRNGLVGFDHIDKSSGRTVLNRRSRYDIAVVQRVDEQLNIDELVGK